MKNSSTIKAKALIELMRINNCVMASVAVLIAAIIASTTQNFFLQPLIGNSAATILAMVSAFVICGGGQAINDYFDAKIDSKINKNKPIPSKRITKTQTLLFSITLYFIGIILASLINEFSFSIAIWIVVLLTIYSGLMTKIKYLGNIVVAFSTAMTFIFGAAAINNITPIILLFAITAFFANIAREITKDYEDMKKDKGTKQTLPIVFGKKAMPLTSFFYFVAPALAINGGIIFGLNYLYLAGMIISTIFFGFAYNNLMNKKYVFAQKKCKQAMMVSLIAFVLSIVIL